VAKSETYITPGKILTPVEGFSNRVTGTPPKPGRRGFPKDPGTGRIGQEAGKGKSGASNALKAFGLDGKSRDDK
jgi:hypothetical protein